MKFATPQEAIEAAEKEAEMTGGPDEFEGMNCNDYLDDDQLGCTGWDGFSRRCDCGNRRVFWDTYGDKESGFVAFANAY
jgi:hypothetical protein